MNKIISDTALKRRSSKSPLIASEDVVRYLKENPSFFQEYPHLLETIKLPPNQAGVISLVDYQVDLLKNKNKKLNATLAEMISAAEENEKLLRATQRFAISLFESTSLVDLSEKTEKNAKESFQVEVARLRFFENESLVWPDECCPLKRHEAEFLFKPLFDKPAWCGKLYPPQLNYIFDDQTALAASTAIVILKMGHHAIGIFALGSLDSHRFHEGKGSLFLEFMGDLLSHRIPLFFGA